MRANLPRTTGVGLGAIAFAVLLLAMAVAPAPAHARTSTSLSVSASSSYSRVYRSVTIRGRLTTKAGRALSGRTLRLESRPVNGTTWTLVTKATTGSTGRVARNVRPRSDTVYRYRFTGNTRYHASVSATRKIIGHHYALKFWEPFDGTSLNSSTWTPEMQWGTHTTGLLQVYTRSALDVDSGRLIITADERTPTSDDKSAYTSGVVSAHGPGQYSFKYGYIETRARVPRGTGLWSAVWMLPKDPAAGAEIDVMEIRGQYPARNDMTLHFSSEQVKSAYYGPDFSAGYHTFAVKWDPSAVVWYCDGVERWRVTNDSQIPDVPMYPIANIQMGGWGGTPTQYTRFPARLYVDYIKVYQHE